MARLAQILRVGSEHFAKRRVGAHVLAEECRSWGAAICEGETGPVEFIKTTIFRFSSGKYLFSDAGGFFVYAVTVAVLLVKPAGFYGRE